MFLDPNEMVLNFLRHPRYTTESWYLLLGDIDEVVRDETINFIFYANDRIVKLVRVHDPTYGVDLHVDHFAAACMAVFLRGRPLELDGTPPPTGIADFAGWGGDWIQHYGLWQDALSIEPMKWYSGLEFCRARLAKTAEEMKAGLFDSTFKLRDLLEDIAAYNIGMNLRQKAPVATKIVDEITFAFQGPGRLTRYRDFYARRFNSSPTAVKAAATSMLLRHLPVGPDDSVVIWVAQSRLVTRQYENAIMAWDMPSDRLSAFCDGLVEMLVAKVEEEKKLSV
jgi:hypothetical protein